MASALVEAMAAHIAHGLKRKGVTTCSKWAEKYRVMGKPFPGPWTFRHHPWLKSMMDCDTEMWVGQKAAQVGFTEAVLNRCFFKIDIEKTDCLYVLPSKNPDASDFSASRFDPALELSDHLNDLFSDVKNVGHKRAGSTNLYIRGSRSRSQLKSIPVGFIVLDEVEEMNQENIPLALERQSGQINRQCAAISTPRLDGSGINLLFRNTTQEHFYFRCPHCGRLTELTFPDCIVITAEEVNDPRIRDTYLQCKECKNVLQHNTKPDWLENAMWVPSYTDRDNRGFHISQLYSCVIEPSKIAQKYFLAQTNPTDEQEFYNSALGLTHTVADARITDGDLIAVTREYSKRSRIPNNAIITIGIDQGKWIHCEVDCWSFPDIMTADLNAEAICKVIDAIRFEHFEQLDKLFYDWQPNAVVIDAQPETRKAVELAARFPGKIFLCYYSPVSGQGKQLSISPDYQEKRVTVDRTYWMDAALSRFHTNRITLPCDVGYEYKEHLKVPARSYERDKNGNPVGRYVTPANTADHYAHARTYAEIALNFAMTLSQPQSMRSPR